MVNKKENVWGFPRPAICEPGGSSFGKVIAKTDRSFRSLETFHPPSYYIPPDDIKMDVLLYNQRVTLCEWKGKASYFNFEGGDRSITDIA